MSRKSVKTHITFVSVTPRSKPSPVIENPIDVYEAIGYVNDYDSLLVAIRELTEGKEHNLFFHNDVHHDYFFDGTSLNNGAIYGRRERKKDGEGIGSRVTARNLIPIQTSDRFKQVVAGTGEVVYKKQGVSRHGRRPKVSEKVKNKRVDHIIVEICVILLKSKAKKDTPKLVTVSCNQSAESISNSTLPVSIMKRKRDDFVFKSRDLSITLYAPIETLEKPTSKITCVPAGKTNKQLGYSIERFILGGGEGDTDEDEEDVDVDEVLNNDEFFRMMFTLSRFRKDIMVLALELFPEEYSVECKSLGPRCKLFCQRQWNSSSWTEIPDTESLVRLLKEQMTVKARVNNGVLSIRLAFGRAKQGQQFADNDAFNDYTHIFEGESESLLFSKDKNACSPYVRRFGDKKRSKNWSQPTQINTLINTMYLAADCKLYYGFLREHSNSFFRIISANLAHLKESSPFKSFVNNPTSTPSDSIIDQHLLTVFVASFQNDINGNYIPETYKYPPTNEDMLKVPPPLREWKQSTRHTTNTLQHEPSTVSPHLQKVTTVSNVVDNGEIIVISFQHAVDGNEISVMVGDGLSNISTLEAVMKEGDVVSEFDLDIELGEGEQLNTPTKNNNMTVDYKFCIKRNNGSFITFRWNKIRQMTVGNMIRIKNIHEDNLIVIK